MRKIFITLLIVMFGATLQAQNEKLRVAVFDPTSSGTAIDEGTKVAVREIISSTFVNTGRYIIVERSLLQQVMREQKMSNTDAFDDSQATALGKLAGANKVVLSVVTLVGGRNMLSIKVIDVETATVELQKTRVVSSNDLLDAVEPLTLELLGEAVSQTQQSQNKQTSVPKSNNNNNSSQSVNLSKYTQGKEITFTCEPFPLVRIGASVVKVFLDEDMIWTGGGEGFVIKIKDPNPGKRMFRIVLSNDRLKSVTGGGTFNIDTSVQEHFEFTTNKLNFNARLKK